MPRIYDGGPAFPGTWENDSDLNQTAPDGTVVPPLGVRHMPGLSMRDYFAAKAMQAMLTNVNVAEAPNEKISEWAYQVADAMLAARSKS